MENIGNDRGTIQTVAAGGVRLQRRQTARSPLRAVFDPLWGGMAKSRSPNGSGSFLLQHVHGLLGDAQKAIGRQTGTANEAAVDVGL